MLLHPVLQREPEQKGKASHLMGVAQPLQKLMRYLFCIFLFSVAQYHPLSCIASRACCTEQCFKLQTIVFFNCTFSFFLYVTLQANLFLYCFQKIISPEIIRYGAFYISLKELVDSMKPVQWLSKIVIETGILHIMDNLPEGSKKVVMPLRFSVSFSKTFFTLIFVL